MENAVGALDEASSDYTKVPIVQRVSLLVKNVCLEVKERSDGVVQSKESRNDDNVQWSS